MSAAEWRESHSCRKHAQLVEADPEPTLFSAQGFCFTQSGAECVSAAPDRSSLSSRDTDITSDRGVTPDTWARG